MAATVKDVLQPPEGQSSPGSPPAAPSSAPRQQFQLFFVAPLQCGSGRYPMDRPTGEQRGHLHGAPCRSGTCILNGYMRAVPHLQPSRTEGRRGRASTCQHTIGGRSEIRRQPNHVPAFVGDVFLSRWGDKTAAQFIARFLYCHRVTRVRLV